MALAQSPSIVTNGLVFYYDMNNVKKSWRGRPVTNQFTLPTQDVNGFGVQNSTFTRIRTGTYAGYDIQPTDYVWRYNVTGNDCPYHGWDIATTAGTVVTFSFDYYVDPTTTNYPVTNYLANFENAGSGVSGSLGDSTPSVKGVWKRAYFSSTASATGNSRCLLYPGACGGRLGDAGFILYKNPQVEFNAPGSIPTPFVAGTRSSTQAILDLTNQNTITAESLTYASDGTFSFNPANSNYIDSNPAAGLTGTGSWTMESWFKINGAPSNLSYGNVIVDTDATGGSANMIVVDYGGLHGGSQNQLLYATRPSTGGSYTNLLGPVLTQGTYYHVAVVRNSTTDTKLYVNGILNNTYSGNMPTATQPLVRVGRWTDGTVYSNTTIPVVKIYNRNLSDSEVLQNFYAQRGLYGI